MNPQPTFEQEVELAKEQFKTFRQNDEGMIALARLSTPTGEVVMGLNLPTADMRSYAITSMVLEHKAQRVVWIADSWVKTFQKDEVDIDKSGPLRVEKLPSEYEDRTEALIVTLVTADETRLAMIPYNVVGELIFFGTLMDMSKGAIGTHEQIQEAIRRVKAGG